MAEPSSAVPPALGSGPGDQAPVAHGTRSRGDLSSAGAEAEAGAVHGSVPWSAACAQNNKLSTSSTTIPKSSGNNYEPHQHANTAAEAQRKRAGDALSDQDQLEKVNQNLWQGQTTTTSADAEMRCKRARQLEIPWNLGTRCSSIELSSHARPIVEYDSPHDRREPAANAVQGDYPHTGKQQEEQSASAAAPATTEQIRSRKRARGAPGTTRPKAEPELEPQSAAAAAQGMRAQGAPDTLPLKAEPELEPQSAGAAAQGMRAQGAPDTLPLEAEPELEPQSAGAATQGVRAQGAPGTPPLKAEPELEPQSAVAAAQGMRAQGAPDTLPLKAEPELEPQSAGAAAQGMRAQGAPDTLPLEAEPELEPQSAGAATQGVRAQGAPGTPPPKAEPELEPQLPGAAAQQTQASSAPDKVRPEAGVARKRSKPGYDEARSKGETGEKDEGAPPPLQYEGVEAGERTIMKISRSFEQYVRVGEGEEPKGMSKRHAHDQGDNEPGPTRQQWIEA